MFFSTYTFPYFSLWIYYVMFYTSLFCSIFFSISLFVFILFYFIFTSLFFSFCISTTPVSTNCGCFKLRLRKLFIYFNGGFLLRYRVHKMSLYFLKLQSLKFRAPTVESWFTPSSSCFGRAWFFFVRLPLVTPVKISRGHVMAWPGLPDFSWYYLPRMGKNIPNDYKISKCTWNIPDGSKIFTMTKLCNNIFNSKILQNIP
jgi:hypothetical protein